MLIIPKIDALNKKRCRIQENKRTRCDKIGVNKFECERLDCCYDSNPNSEIQCYSSNFKREECEIKRSDQVVNRCGHLVMEEESCLKLGCCFDARKYDGWEYDVNLSGFMCYFPPSLNISDEVKSSFGLTDYNDDYFNKSIKITYVWVNRLNLFTVCP